MGVEVTTLNGVMSDINRVLFIAPPTIQLEISIFSRLRRKKALLRVNDRGGGWKMCILALRRVCVCTYARSGTSAVN